MIVSKKCHMEIDFTWHIEGSMTLQIGDARKGLLSQGYQFKCNHGR